MVTNGQATEEAVPITATPIPITLIDPSALNRHSADTDADIAELAQTIEENGLFSPISIRPRENGRYEIVFGERRWRAFRLLERDTIPCFVKDLDDTQAQIERIVENFQRRDPSFMEQGEAVAALMELTDRDVSEVANRLGQSISWVRRRAKLPNLIPAWREELAQDNTPYTAIHDSVNKLEEIAILPPATQQTILDASVLRHVKTTKELREKIARFFMSLDSKPWSREWEKKAFSGSGKRRCDACMKRSDRESALFADPDNPNAGKKMCLDPECWKNKCLSWCKHLLTTSPDMIPIWEGCSYGNDNLAAFFGVKPVASYEWQERRETETREGYAALVGVVVDGATIGTTKPVWIREPDESDEEDNDVSAARAWQRSNTNRHRERAALAELMTADVTLYLADIDTNATPPAAKLAYNKLRAAAWFGISGYANSEEEPARPDDPNWNPLAWAWEQTTERIARHVAHTTASDITQIYNGDSDAKTDAASTAALTALFEIPLDMIATRAADTLYTATRNEKDANEEEQDETEGIEQDSADGAPEEDSPEPADPVAALDIDALTDPEDTIPVSYLHVLANAQ